MNNDLTPAKAAAHWADHIAVFDLETTALDLKEARIVTACVLELDATGKVISDNKEWLVNPGVEIPANTTEIHGITNEKATAEGKPAKEAIAEIINSLQNLMDRGIPVIAYNAPYDFTVLHYEALRYNLTPLNIKSVIDPLVIDRTKDKFRKGSRKLTDTAKHYGCELSNAHNATADAIAAGRVAQALAKKYASSIPTTAVELHNAQILWEKDISDNYEKYMHGKGETTFKATRGWPIRQL